jgi:TfoX/Sxy family transcriptional regulator of competence genes
MAGSARRTTKAFEGEAGLVDLLRAALPAKGLSEKKMFGGTGFMLNGNMVAGTFRDGLLVRVGKERHEEALARPGAGPMLMRGRPIDGYVLVDGKSLGAAAVANWARLALAFVRTLPPKSPKPKTARKKGAKR